MSRPGGGGTRGVVGGPRRVVGGPRGLRAASARGGIEREAQVEAGYLHFITLEYFLLTSRNGPLGSERKRG